MTTPQPLDPQTVPPYPVVRMNIDRRPDGSCVGQVDGSIITTGDEDAVRTACLQAVATKAERRPLKAVRVSAVDEHGQTWPMVVEADGTVHDLSRPQRTGAPRKPIAIALGAGALVVILVAATAAAISQRPSAQPPASTVTVIVPPSATPSELPALAPDGWSTHAEWYSPSLAAAAIPNVVQLPDTLILGTTDGTSTSLTALAADTGQPRWTVPLGRTLTAGPALTTIDGQDLIAVASSDQLLLVDTAGQTRHKFPIETGTKVTITPTGVIVSADATSALIAVDGELVPRVIPAGGQPVAVLDDALIVASPTAQWWVVTDPATAPDPQQLQTTTQIERPVGPIGLAGDTLLFAWAPDNRTADLPWTVTGHSITQSMTRILQVNAAAGTSTIPRPEDWRAAPDGTWGIYGQTLIDISADRSQVLPRDWNTATVLDDRAWSRRSQTQLLSVGRDGSATTQNGHVAISVPVAATDELLIVAAEDSTGVRLYALPAATNTSPTPLPTASTTQ